MIAIRQCLRLKEDVSCGEVAWGDNRSRVSSKNLPIYRVCGCWLPIHIDGTLRTKYCNANAWKKLCQLGECDNEM